MSKQVQTLVQLPWRFLSMWSWPHIQDPPQPRSLESGTAVKKDRCLSQALFGCILLSAVPFHFNIIPWAVIIISTQQSVPSRIPCSGTTRHCTLEAHHDQRFAWCDRVFDNRLVSFTTSVQVERAVSWRSQTTGAAENPDWSRPFIFTQLTLLKKFTEITVSKRMAEAIPINKVKSSKRPQGLILFKMLYIISITVLGYSSYQ